MENEAIIPPNSIELEESLLSALFDDTEAVNEASKILKSNHFYRTAHQHLFNAFVQLIHNGEPPDGILLFEQLKRSGKIEEIGGAAALAKLKHTVLPSTDVIAYAEKIRDLAIKRQVIERAHAIIKRASNGADSSETIRYAIDSLQEITRPEFNSHRSTVHISNVYTSERMVSEYQAYLRNLRDNRFTTGIIPVDHAIRGIGGGEVMTILARAGSFKTALLQNMLKRYAKTSSLYAVFFSIEMPVASLAERYFEILDGSTGKEVERMFLDQSQAEICAGSVIQFKRDLERLLIVDTKVSLEQIPQYVDMIQRELGRRVGLIGIDYLGLMDAPGKEEYAQVSHLARGMKTMAKAVNLPVVLLSQVSRKGGDGEVEVSLDMGRGSGQIEEAADIVIGLWQEEEAHCNPAEPEYRLICRILKNRKGGRGKRFILELDPATLRFGENAVEYVKPKKARRKKGEC